MWIGAGYPVMAAAISVLWIALQKSQNARLKEREGNANVIRMLQKFVKDRKTKIRPRGGADDESGISDS